MKKTLCSIALLLAATNAHATQETFTNAGVLDCSAVSYCLQNTADNLFTLKFTPTYPTSAPSALGFDVKQRSIEVHNANGGALDMSIMQVALTGSQAYNGMTFIGAIQLETQDATGAWTYRTQWSSFIGARKGIYVMFNGKNLASPLVRGVYGIRLTAVNGGTAFRIGMLNLTAK